MVKQSINSVKVFCMGEMVPLEKLVPHPRNDRVHPDRQIELLADIMRAQGIRYSIVVSKRSGFIVSGHGRLEAARMLGLKEYPCDWQDFPDEAAEVAQLTADNRLMLLAEFNEEQTQLNLKDLGIDFALACRKLP